jgi:hypothetical protein
MAPKVAKTTPISSLSTTTGFLAQRTEASKLHGTDVNSVYIPLLGGIDDRYYPGKPDHRVELFIAQLRKEANFNKQEGESYKAVRSISNSVLTGVQTFPGFKATTERITQDEGNVQFKRPLPWMIDKEPLYNEMLKFLCELTERLNGQPVSSKTEAIDFIKTIPGMPDAGERNFAIAVVQTFVIELRNTSSNIIEKPQEWASVTHGTYYSKIDIIHTLFGYKGTRLTSAYSAAHANLPDESIMQTYRDAINAVKCDNIFSTSRVFTSYALERFLQKQVEAAINQIEKVENDASTKPSSTPTPTLLNSTLLDNLKKYDKSIKPVENYRYIRKDDKQLYILTPDGTEKRAKDFTTDDACKATGLKDPNYHYFCNTFLQDCINGKNVGACANFLQGATFWSKGVVDYLDNINLFLAHLALEKYKIPHVDVNGIVMYDTVVAWHKKLEEYASAGNEGLNTSAVAAIKANEALNAVIEGIIGQINARPAILNPDAIGDTVIEEAKTPSPVLALLRGTNNLHPSQPKGRIALGEVKVIVDKHVEEINAHLDAIKKLSPHMLRVIAGSPNISVHPMFNQLFLRALTGGNQAGGDRIKIDEYNVQSTDFYDHYKNIEKLIKLTDTGEMPAWLYTTVKNTETILTQNGINIAKGDLDHIYKVIENLNKVEKQILFALKGAMKFALVLNSDIGPVVKDQPSDNRADDASFNGLYTFKHKTIDQMFKMFEIAINKLEKYCSKTNKVGGLCSYLVDLSQ